MPALTSLEASALWLDRFGAFVDDFCAHLRRTNAAFTTRRALQTAQRNEERDHQRDLIAAGFCRHSCGRLAALPAGECFQCAAKGMPCS